MITAEQFADVVNARSILSQELDRKQMELHELRGAMIEIRASAQTARSMITPRHNSIRFLRTIERICTESLRPGPDPTNMMGQDEAPMERKPEGGAS